MLNKNRIISLMFVLLLVVPSMAQTSKQSRSRESSRSERPEDSRSRESSNSDRSNDSRTRGSSNSDRSNDSRSRESSKSDRTDDSKSKEPSKSSRSQDSRLKKPVTKKPVARRTNGTKGIITMPNGRSPKVVYLPKKGDFSIGLGANALLNFVGNMFNGTIAQTIQPLGGSVLLSNASSPKVSIMGKYMQSDNFAIRFNVGYLFGIDNKARYVRDDNAFMQDPLSEDKVTDYHKATTHGGSISLGIERRMGKERLQGIFSVSALYSLSITSNEYDYGNAITDVNQKPTIDDLVESLSPGYNTTVPHIPNARTLKNFSANPSNTAGLVVGLGVEWFVAPKISLGAEINLAALYTWTPEVFSLLEGYSTKTGKLEEYTKKIAPPSQSFQFGTKNIGGDLSLNFYF